MDNGREGYSQLRGVQNVHVCGHHRTFGDPLTRVIGKRLTAVQWGHVIGRYLNGQAVERPRKGPPQDHCDEVPRDGPQQSARRLEARREHHLARGSAGSWGSGAVGHRGSFDVAAWRPPRTAWRSGRIACRSGFAAAGHCSLLSLTPYDRNICPLLVNLFAEILFSFRSRVRCDCLVSMVGYGKGARRRAFISFSGQGEPR